MFSPEQKNLHPFYEVKIEVQAAGHVDRLIYLVFLLPGLQLDIFSIISCCKEEITKPRCLRGCGDTKGGHLEAASVTHLYEYQDIRDHHNPPTHVAGRLTWILIFFGKSLGVVL